MNFSIRLFFLSLISSWCFLFTAAGQDTESTNVINATLLETSSMTILGSSTLHDWEVEATEFNVEFMVPEYWFESPENWSGSDVAGLRVTVPVDKLDGGKNKMNRDLKDALGYPEYQSIDFIWKKITFVGDNDIGRSATVDGLVTIAGETRQISFNADLSLNEWSQIVVSGSVKLDMEEFGVKPPTAFFGVIRTDKIVDLSYELFFGKE